MKVIGSWNEFQKSTRGWFDNRKRAAEGWKQYKKTAYGSKKIAIGRIKYTTKASKNGYQILDSDYWSPTVNDAWIQGGIDADKDFHLVSKNIDVNRINSDYPDNNRFKYTVFDREIKRLESHGYKQEGNKMINRKNIRCV